MRKRYLLVLGSCLAVVGIYVAVQQCRKRTIDRILKRAQLAALPPTFHDCDVSENEYMWFVVRNLRYEAEPHELAEWAKIWRDRASRVPSWPSRLTLHTPAHGTTSVDLDVGAGWVSIEQIDPEWDEP